MKTLISTYSKLSDELGEVYERHIFKSFKTEHRILGIVGGRGVGKTTFMLHYLKRKYGDSKQVLYVSADNIFFSKNTLLDLVDQFTNEYNGKLLCIDEIHRYPNWAQELKNIYDIYKNFKIIFSGSSSIDLIKQRYDLSRRAVLKHLYGLSFREYLEFTLGKKFPPLSLNNVIKNRIQSVRKITKTPRLLGLFKDYLKIGYYPISSQFKKKASVFEAINGVIDKVINSDIASYYTLKTTTLPVFKKILYFIHTSKPSSINVNRLAKSLGRYHQETEGYLEMMRESGLLRYLLVDKLGHALVRNAEKVYLDNTNLAYAIGYKTGKNAGIGTIRELFAINQLEAAGYKVFYSKVGDIACDDYIFEIGGKNKSTEQVKGERNAYLLKDDIVYGDVKSIPLYLVGFLY